MSSTADTDDVIEVSADGLTVRKTFAPDEFPVPAIRFEIESDRDDQVAFRLSENIPETFPMDKVGFHPDYHSDSWTAFQDNHVEFTGSLESHDKLVTVYGIRIDDENTADQFLTEPQIVEVSTEGEGGSDADEIDDAVIGDIVSGDREQAVKDMITDDSEAVPGLEDDDSGTGDDSEGADGTDLEADSGSLDLDLGLDEDGTSNAGDHEDITLDIEPETDGETGSGSGSTDEDDVPEIDLDADSDTEPGADAGTSESGDPVGTDDAGEAGDAGRETDRSDATSRTADAEPVSTMTGDGSVVAELATELREGTVDDDDLEVIQSELDLEPSAPELAKLDHVTSRVEEVAAYTEALEEFLEENGTGKQLIEELRGSLDSLEDEVAAVDDRVAGTENRVDDVETDIETVQADVEGVTTGLDGVENDVAALEADVDDVTDDVSSVEGDVEGLTEDLNHVEADVEEFEDDLEDLEDDLEGVETELEEVRADVTDIQDWRDQLGSMFSE